MGIEAALLTRPVWQGEHLDFLDARILSAPLQELCACDCLATEVSEIEHALKSADSLWLIFTSPASVDAFFAWLARHRKIHAAFKNQKTGLLRLAAVGEGTRDKIFHHPEAALFPGVKSQEIVVGEDAAHADARSLLAAIKKSSLNVSAQNALLIQGKDSRPTLHDGLIESGFKVRTLSLYERITVSWNKAIYERLKAASPQTIAVVVTSSQAVDLALEQMKKAGVEPLAQVWATHHQTIAGLLKQKEWGQVLKVRLAPEALARDLFEHQSTW